MNWQKIKQKILTADQLTSWANAIKESGQTTVFTNGCFDLVHLGHIDYLSKTSDLADCMIVAVNSDASVKRLNKGDARPIKDELQRSVIMASFSFVDAVVVFDEDTPIEVIKKIRPNVLVKGGDYNVNQINAQAKDYIVGSKEVRSWNGVVEVIPFVDGYSTTKLEQKVLSQKKNG